NNGGTITVPNGTDTLVVLTGTQTLTNKTLTAPIISTISNTGTLTLPTSTDTLVGKATVDILTNKTLTGAGVSDYLDFTQTTTPSNPAASHDRLYFKSGDGLYYVNSSGVESQILTTAGTLPI